MKKKYLIVGLLGALLGIISMGGGNAQATLINKGLGIITSGGSGSCNLIYDSDLNITWLDYTNPRDGWENQLSWAKQLSVSFNGTELQGWRLPATVDGVYKYDYVGPDQQGNYKYTIGYNLANSEMGHLYYTELGNKAYYATDGSSPQQGWGLISTGCFDNLKALREDCNPAWYWAETEYAAENYLAWAFSFYDGRLGRGGKDGLVYGIAVRPGDIEIPMLDSDTKVISNPVPAPVLLLGTGLAGLLGKRIRQRKSSKI